MKVIRNILLISLVLLVQSTLFGRYDLYGVRPDIALIVLIFLSNEASPVGCICYGFFIGFLQDVYTPEYLGYNTFSMTIMAFLLSKIHERLTVENYMVKLFATFFACMIHDAVYLSLYTQFELSVLVSLLVRESLPGAVYTSVLAVLLVRIWQWVQCGGLLIVVRELLGSGR